MADGSSTTPSSGDGTTRAFSLATARDVAFLAAIYLYFAGFVYGDFFTHTFGIPAATDTPVYTYLIYAYNALTPNLAQLSALAIALFGASVYFSILGTKARPARWETTLVNSERALLAVGALGLFPLLFFCAQRAALANADAIRCGASSGAARVVLSFKPERAATYDADFVAASKQGSVLLLARSADAYFVMYQPAGGAPVLRGSSSASTPAPAAGGCGFLSAARTYEVAKTDLDHVMTLAPTIYR
ncbi:MAG: hypothetical protein ACLPYS_17610 [Vulcanimicrobiaceae bacterium]